MCPVELSRAESRRASPDLDIDINVLKYYFIISNRIFNNGKWFIPLSGHSQRKISPFYRDDIRPTAMFTTKLINNENNQT